MTSSEIKNDLHRIIKERRLSMGLTLGELGLMSGVSPSHLGRIERGERFPSARILKKIAKPLDFSETEMFVIADFLTSQATCDFGETGVNRLDPCVSKLLSSEPVSTQRALVGILSILKSLANIAD